MFELHPDDVKAQAIEIDSTIQDMAQNARDEMGSIGEEIQGRNMAMFDQFSGTLSFAIQQSGNTFKNIGMAFKNMLTQMATELAAKSAIFGLLSLFGVAPAGGFAKNVFGGFFAEGGQPPVNKPSIVGEKGPELFVPRTAGTIIPNNKVGNTINVSFNGNITDKRYVEEFIVPELERVVRQSA